MSYDEYNADNLEKSGNMLCVNPDGVDSLTGNVVDGSFQFVCQKCGKPLDRWYNGELTTSSRKTLLNGETLSA